MFYGLSLVFFSGKKHSRTMTSSVYLRTVLLCLQAKEIQKKLHNIPIVAAFGEEI